MIPGPSCTRIGVAAILVAAIAVQYLYSGVLHQAEHRHEVAECEEAEAGHHHHDHSCETQEVPCDCPEGHDCDYCKSPVQLVWRPESPRGVELPPVPEVTIRLVAATPARRDVPGPVPRVPTSPRARSGVLTALLLI